eukprot:TRINITY_DN23597_c0_g1_i1.p1 TRINITY_DN23597_c0_g1~~TRINITY_DN23597_c0_g1_i1.p1  ORF type:complete len:712 (-),score=117.31 TRINITY_DN23597_c0_g1_i1:38-2173(-)
MGHGSSAILPAICCTLLYSSSCEGGKEMSTSLPPHTISRGTRLPENTSAPVSSTDDLSKAELKKRSITYEAAIAAFSGILVIGSVYVLYQHKRKISEKNAVKAGVKNDGAAKEGGGVGYKFEPLLQGENAADVAEGDLGGLGKLSEEEMAEALGDDNQQMSAEEKKQRVIRWAQAHAEKLRAEHASYLALRRWVLVGLMALYIAASVGLPYIHRGEASCTQGFFWETHMQFFAAFFFTKLVELWLFAKDETIEGDVSVQDLLQRFMPSFLGYLDGYTDANAIFIALSCDNELAQELGFWMAISYAVGVVFMQWAVMFYFAAQDPSQVCLLKLLHMDLLASCVTLPTEQKWTWDMLAASRTIGEDIPQALLQTIYLFKVKKNPFMLLSVVMAVMSSLKALHDARARALAAAGADEEFKNRKRELVVYSCSQDTTIRCWDVGAKSCKKVINAGSPANCIAASGGMLYSSHDDGYVREWSPEGGEVTRKFAHRGGNAVIVGTAEKLVSWASGSRLCYKVWSLDSGECLKEIDAPHMMKATMILKGGSLFANAADNTCNVGQWSLESGELIRTFEGHTGDINALFATSKRLLTGSMDGTAKEWSLESGTCTRTFDDHSEHFLAPLIVVREFLYNASNREPVINEFSLITGQIIRQFAGHESGVLSIVRLQDKLYSSSEDATIKEWALDTGECLQTFEGHQDFISGIIVQYQDDDE